LSKVALHFVVIRAPIALAVRIAFAHSVRLLAVARQVSNWVPLRFKHRLRKLRCDLNCPPGLRLPFIVEFRNNLGGLLACMRCTCPAHPSVFKPTRTLAFQIHTR
jgi:hypothetical protein